MANVTCNIFGERPFSVEVNPVGTENNNSSIITLVNIIGEKKDILMGWAPVTGVQVAAGIDANIAKGLSGNYIVTQFGDKVTTIRLTGVTFSPNVIVYTQDGIRSDSIQGMYEKHRGSRMEGNRVFLVTKDNADTRIYECVLVSMVLEGDASQNTAGQSIEYSLHLIGVVVN
jgi:hypothetical protein